MGSRFADRSAHGAGGRIHLRLGTSRARNRGGECRAAPFSETASPFLLPLLVVVNGAALIDLTTVVDVDDECQRGCGGIANYETDIREAEGHVIMKRCDAVAKRILD